MSNLRPAGLVALVVAGALGVTFIGRHHSAVRVAVERRVVVTAVAHLSASASTTGRRWPTETPTAFLSPTPTATSTVPAATPTPVTSTSVRTGGISYPLSELQDIQQAVNRNDPRYRYYLDSVQVTLRDLPRYGFVAGRISLISPPPPQPAPTAHHGEDGNPECDVIVRYRGRQYWIVLNQFMRHGPGGIWSIITITPM